MASPCKLQARLQSKNQIFRLASSAYLAGECTSPDIYEYICAGLVALVSLRAALRLSKEDDDEY